MRPRSPERRRAPSYSAPIGYVLSNWKMYPGREQAVELFASLQHRLREAARCESELPVTIVCPPVVSLMAIAAIADRRLVRLGAQNCHWEATGPYTGEVSPATVAGLVDYVLVGHSERRQAGETDEQIARKVAAVAGHGMTPILFVGEDEPTSEAARETEERLQRGLARLDVASRPLLVVYEPAWAIGAQAPAAAEHVAALAVRLKRRLSEMGAQRPAVIYGGTVTADNAGDFAAIEALDGVGATRAALDGDGLLAIVRSVARARATARGD